MAGALVASALLVAAVLLGRPAARLPSSLGRPKGLPGEHRGASVAAGTALGEIPVGVLADLVVALLEAGLPLDAVVEMLRHHLDRAGLAEPAGLAPVLQALELSARTGAAPAAMVRAAAGEQRRVQAGAQAQAARRLSVMVMLPMGLCLLPAFLVLTVVPLVVGLLAAQL